MLDKCAHGRGRKCVQKHGSTYACRTWNGCGLRKDVPGGATTGRTTTFEYTTRIQFSTVTQVKEFRRAGQNLQSLRTAYNGQYCSQRLPYPLHARTTSRTCLSATKSFQRSNAIVFRYRLARISRTARAHFSKARFCKHASYHRLSSRRRRERRCEHRLSMRQHVDAHWQNIL